MRDVLDPFTMCDDTMQTIERVDRELYFVRSKRMQYTERTDLKHDASSQLTPWQAYVSDFAVADGKVVYLFKEEEHANPNLYELDLVRHTLRLLERNVAAYILIGLFDGVPVLYNVDDQVWLASQPERRIGVPSSLVALQTRDAVWLDPYDNLTEVIGADLTLDDGRLVVRSTDSRARRRDLNAIREAALAARQLPPDCHALCINVRPQCALPSQSMESGHLLHITKTADKRIPYEGGHAMVDGRTGTVVWLDDDDRLCLLFGDWRPNAESAHT